MIRFARLLEGLLFTPARNGKLRLITEYFAETGDPERGWALAALTGELVFREAKPAALRELVYSRVDPELFGWSYDYVGDLAETVALIWPEKPRIQTPAVMPGLDPGIHTVPLDQTGEHGSPGSTPWMAGSSPAMTGSNTEETSSPDIPSSLQTSSSPDLIRESRPMESSASARDPRIKPGDDGMGGDEVGAVRDSSSSRGRRLGGGGLSAEDTNVEDGFIPQTDLADTPPPPGLLPRGKEENTVPSLTHIVDSLRASRRADVKALIEPWLDALDATARWALLKLVTGGLRVGVSARLAKTALADWSGVAVEEIEEIWHGVEPPYSDLFAWLSGAGDRPHPGDKPVFLPLMLSTPIEDTDFPNYNAADYLAEWKWDGIRVQLASIGGEARVWSRSGDDISKAFPDIVSIIPEKVILDGELLVGRDGEVAPFNDLQQRLNRKTASAQMLDNYPAFVRLYDILRVDGEDVRALPQTARREVLEAWYGKAPRPGLDLSPVIPFASWDEIAELRANARAQGIEGLMLKRRDTPYVSGRPKGPWFKWKRDALTLDCVMMYAQRGHGKRSSFYSDYTFGAWRGAELVPVGKAYSGFTDEELVKLDRWVRNNTAKRYGPVREVSQGLVLEIAFDSVHLSTRHKSGYAMRFPRVHRIRWDKPANEADTVENLARLMAS